MFGGGDETESLIEVHRRVVGCVGNDEPRSRRCTGRDCFAMGFGEQYCTEPPLFVWRGVIAQYRSHRETEVADNAERRE